MYNPEISAKINAWRHKAALGQLSIEETREAVLVMRQERVGAAVQSEKSRTKSAAKKQVAPTADELLNELGDL